MSQSALTRVWCLAAPLLLALPIASADAAAPAQLRGIASTATWVAGDVNGDGVADLMGRPGDRVGVTFGPGDVRNSPSGPGLEVAAASGETLGAVLDAGDFDGDGKDDLLVSARRGTAASGTDLVYVVHGAAAAGTVTATAGARVTAIALGSRFFFGGEPRFIGDINGDGKDDVTVSRSTKPDISTTGWVGGAALVFGGAAGATINANAASARTIVINTVRSCSFIFTSYLCGASSLRVDPVGDVNRDGRDDVYVDGSRPDRRWVLLGRTTTGTINAGSIPPQAVRTPALDSLGTFPEPAGDVNDDGFGDFTVAAKVTDATTTPQRRVVILGSAQTSGTYTAGPSLTSAGEVGVAKLIDDQTGDGRRDLIVLTKTLDDDEPNWDDPDSWDQTFETSLARIHARIVSIPRGATGMIDLDAAPAIKGLPEAGYSRNASDSILTLRVGNVDADARLEVGFYGGGKLILADVGTDRLAPELTDLPSLGIKGVTLPNGAVSRTTGVPRTFRVSELAAVQLEYLRPDGSLAAKESKALGAGTTRDRWFGLVGKTPLPDGTYTLKATPRDGVGNWGKPQTQTVVIASGSPSEATVELEPRYFDATGALPSAYGSYRLECTEGDWVGGVNGVSSVLQTENPLRAGTQCTLRLAYFIGSPIPGECETNPSTVTLNGQQIGTALPVTFTLQPGSNRIIQTVDCTPPVFQPNRVVPALTSPGWWGQALTSTGPSVLTWTTNQTGYQVYQWPIDPNGRTFEFDLTMANGNGAAEGMALSFLQPKPGAAYGGMPGAGGGALGVGGLNGTVVGFDQYKGPGDPASNTVGIANGASATGLNWLQTADAGTRMRGAGAVPVKVVSDGARVSIYVNGSLRMQRTMRLPSPAFVAFSATTSTLWQQQTVENLRVTPTPAG